MATNGGRTSCNIDFPALSIPAKDMEESHSGYDVAALRMREQWDKVVCNELKIPDTYRSVAVLIVHWHSELDVDLKCDREVKELDEIFTKRFNFHSKVLTLHDSVRPQAQLDYAMAELVYKYDGPCRSNLLIVYYTGHGRPRGDNGLDILGVRDPRAIPTSHDAIANWNAAEKCLKRAEADVLFILDTCFAGNIFKGGAEDVRTFQVLAAAGRDMPTSPPGDHSFTRALIQSLKEQLDEGDNSSFTAFDLHCAIMSRRQNMNSHFFPRYSKRSPRLIKLAPLRPTETGSVTLPGRDTAHLTLRFAFRDHGSLDDEQIASLAKEISIGVRKTDLNIRAIDWLDFKQSGSGPRWQKAFGLIGSQRRWAKYVQETRTKRAQSDSSEIDMPPVKRQRSSLDAQAAFLPPFSPSTTPGSQDSSPRL